MLGSILSAGASLIGGLAGGKKSGTGTQLTPFQSLPKEVQDVYLQTYLPDVVENYNKPFTPFPMKRAVNPMDDPFASQGAYEWQQYSDQMGGLFSPFGNKAEQAAPANTDEIPSSIKDVLNTLLMDNMEQQTNPDFWRKEDNNPDYRYKKNLYELIKNATMMDTSGDVMKSIDLTKLVNAKPSEYEGNLQKVTKTASDALRKYLLSVR